MQHAARAVRKWVYFLNERTQRSKQAANRNNLDDDSLAYSSCTRVLSLDKP